MHKNPGVPAMLALAGLAALAACKVNTSEIEASIKTTMKDSKVPLKQLSCPADMPAKVGSTHECTGETEDGEKVLFKVEPSDSLGAANWVLLGKIVVGAEVERSVTAELEKQVIGKPVTVKCAMTMFVFNTGDQFLCDAKVDGADMVVALDATNDEGGYNWELKAKT